MADRAAELVALFSTLVERLRDAGVEVQAVVLKDAQSCHNLERVVVSSPAAVQMHYDGLALLDRAGRPDPRDDRVGTVWGVDVLKPRALEPPPRTPRGRPQTRL